MKVAVSTYTSAIEWSEQWQTRPLFRNLLIWLRSGQVPLLPGFARQYRCWQRSPEPAENEPEVCPLVKTLLNQKLPNKSLGSNRFSWFLRWGVLVKVIPGLISFVPTHHLKASRGPDIHLASRLVNSIIVIRPAANSENS